MDEYVLNQHAGAMMQLVEALAEHGRIVRVDTESRDAHTAAMRLHAEAMSNLNSTLLRYAGLDRGYTANGSSILDDLLQAAARFERAAEVVNEASLRMQR